MGLLSHTPRGISTCGRQVPLSVAGVSFLVVCMPPENRTCVSVAWKNGALPAPGLARLPVRDGHLAPEMITVPRGKVYLGLGNSASGPRWQLQAHCPVCLQPMGPEYLSENFSGYEPGLKGQLGHLRLLWKGPVVTALGIMNIGSAQPCQDTGKQIHRLMSLVLV